MDQIKKLNVAGKITSSYKKLKKNTVVFLFTIVVIVIIVLVILFAIYMYILQQSDLDITWHENGVDMRSIKNKNIPASDIPSVITAVYTMSTWFAVDKSQYNTKQNKSYAPLISYGNLGNDGSPDNLAIGVWIETGTNNLFIVYRLEDDASNLNYNPNSETFNSNGNIHTIEIVNYVLNEWNLLSIVINQNNIMVYLNGQLYQTEVHSSIIYYGQGGAALYIQIGQKNNINGVQKKIRFRNIAENSDEIAKLYFDGPNKFTLPDIRGQHYISNVSTPTILSHLGPISPRRRTFLDWGADIIDGIFNKIHSVKNRRHF